MTSKGTIPPIFANDTSRRIVHVDMDAFYASVEQRDRPELRGRPIAVGHEDGRGVVATASYEARRFGVRSAMPSRRARELCPELIFVPSRIAYYREVSAQIHDIFHRYTDVVEPLSLDEAFLDVTGNKLGLEVGTEVARRIKEDIRRELNLVASAGVSYNKFLAKIASDFRKPGGLCTIHPSRAIAFIDRLPVEALWGVGPATARRFHDMGITTAPQVRALPLSVLTDVFGQAGVMFYKFVRGIDDRPVLAERVRKSVGCEETFEKDIGALDALRAELTAVAEELARRMRKAAFAGRTLTLKVRFSDFTTITRSTTRPGAWPADPTALSEGGVELLSGVAIPPEGVRLLGLSVSSPVSGVSEASGSSERAAPRSEQGTLF